jgi:hypothetical protein
MDAMRKNVLLSCECVASPNSDSFVAFRIANGGAQSSIDEFYGERHLAAIAILGEWVRLLELRIRQQRHLPG